MFDFINKNKQIKTIRSCKKHHPGYPSSNMYCNYFKCLEIYQNPFNYNHLEGFLKSKFVCK